ncbi:hypothetical protein NW759_001656 [Fusarium solani]|nr:hypothetical protein NW759_001656 [Fusarium solani]
MTELKIARIDVFQVDLPYSGGVYHLSGGRTYTSFDGTIVRITTQNGIQGWGESTPFGSNFIASHALGIRAGIAEIAPHLIGLDPRNVDRINDAMDAALLGNETAKAAIDVACWDVFGKSVGLPVCQLLGGSTGDKLPLLLSVPVADAEDTRQLVADVRAQGYKGFSVKIGQDPESDAERIKAALADKKRGEYFTIDANSGLTVETALRTLRLLPEGLDFVLEAPCATWRETMSLRRRTSIPFLIDELLLNEAAAAQIVASDAGEAINLKVSKVGGLTRCRRIRDICLASGITISVQETCGSDISFAAIIHLSQTIPSRMLRPILHSSQMVIPKTADCAFKIHDGFVEGPNTPGLGVTPRLDVLGEPVATYQ